MSCGELQGGVTRRSGRPEVSNLVAIVAALTGETPEGVVARNAGLTTGKFKDVVAEALISSLSPISAELVRLQKVQRLHPHYR